MFGTSLLMRSSSGRQHQNMISFSSPRSESPFLCINGGLADPCAYTRNAGHVAGNQGFYYVYTAKVTREIAAVTVQMEADDLLYSAFMDFMHDYGDRFPLGHAIEMYIYRTRTPLFTAQKIESSPTAYTPTINVVRSTYCIGLRWLLATIGKKFKVVTN